MSIGDLRTPAPARAAPPAWGRHPQTFTTGDTRKPLAARLIRTTVLTGVPCIANLSQKGISSYLAKALARESFAERRVVLIGEPDEINTSEGLQRAAL